MAGKNPRKGKIYIIIKTGVFSKYYIVKSGNLRHIPHQRWCIKAPPPDLFFAAQAKKGPGRVWNHSGKR